MSSLYATQLAKGLPEGVPPQAVAAARESLGAAIDMSAAVADPAREAFVQAMSRASALVALAAALGAFIAWRYLPARGGAHVGRSPDAGGGPAPAHETRRRRVARVGECPPTHDKAATAVATP